MKTRTFHGKEGIRVANELAGMAERAAGESMDGTTRGKFDVLLNEAAVAFTAPRFGRLPTRVEERDRIANLEARMRDLAEEVTEYVGVELQHPVDVGPLIDMADQLRNLHVSFKARSGRPPSDGRFVVLVSYLADVWELGARRKAGTSSAGLSGNRRSGPFVDFVRTAAIFLGDGRAEFGNRTHSALKLINSAMSSEGG